MAESLFISEEYLKTNTVINGNVDYELLKPIIIMVQDINLQQILGTPLYDDLVAKIAANTLSLNETNLIKKYIQKVLLWYVLMESTLDMKFKHMNKGIMVKSGENSQAADTKELLMLMDNRRIKAEAYAELLTKYLKCNTDLFPKYIECDAVGMNPIRTNYTTGIFLDDN